MQTIDKSFVLTYNLALIEVEKKYLDNEELYTLHFSTDVPPVTLKLQRSGDIYHWDTMPSGNAELANAIGGLIEQYEQEHPDEDDDADL